MTAEELVRKEIRRIFGLMFLDEAGGTPRTMSYASKYSGKYRNNKNYPFHKNLTTEDNLEELSPEQVSIPKNYIHEKLNQQIWVDGKLRPEVRKKLLNIGRAFYTSLEIKVPIESIKFVGSMANFNWSSNSDLDVHVYIDFSKINEDIELVKNLMDAKKNIWNSKHKIKIKGYPVELYAQNINEVVQSAGVYDLVNDCWENKPEYNNFQIDKNVIITKIVSIVNQIEEIENGNYSPQEINDKGDDLKNRIRKMRQCGLEEGGEFSNENLAFKYLRSNGYLENLFTITQNAFDADLSLS